MSANNYPAIERLFPLEAREYAASLPYEVDELAGREYPPRTSIDGCEVCPLGAMIYHLVRSEYADTGRTAPFSWRDYSTPVGSEVLDALSALRVYFEPARQGADAVGLDTFYMAFDGAEILGDDLRRALGVEVAE